LQTTASGLSVLLVDDEPDITLSMSKGLTARGYKIDTFNESLQAAKCDPTRYDIAILDIRMPELNGFQLARELWQKNENLQVCFLTGFEIFETEAKAVLPSLKTHCFLKKPMSIEKIASHIQSHFVKQ
jgi:response regulator RpfG family c-di-GMP phosphodiesterase